MLSAAEGGRITPLTWAAYDTEYRPMMVLQSRDVRQTQIEIRDGMRCVTDATIGIAFWSGPKELPFGQPLAITMILMHPEHPAFDVAREGAEFTLREGVKIVAHGKILRRYSDDPSNQSLEPTADRADV